MLCGGARCQRRDPPPTSPPSPSPEGARRPAARCPPPPSRTALRKGSGHGFPRFNSTAPGGRRCRRGRSGPKAPGGGGTERSRSRGAGRLGAEGTAALPPRERHLRATEPLPPRAPAPRNRFPPPPRARAPGPLPGARTRHRAEGGGSGGTAHWLGGVPRGRGGAAWGAAREGRSPLSPSHPPPGSHLTPASPRTGSPVRGRGGTAGRHLIPVLFRREVKQRERRASSAGTWDCRDRPPQGPGPAQSAPTGRPWVSSP